MGTSPTGRLTARVARRSAAVLQGPLRPLGATGLRVAGRRLSDPELRADLLGEAAEIEFGLGREPEALREAIAARLARADRSYRAGKPKHAAGELATALQAACHRVLHFDRPASPLADDPAGYTAPFRESAVAQAVAAAGGRRRPAAPPPAGRPLRLLVMTPGNANFLPLIREHYGAHPGVELRVVHVPTDPVLGELPRGLRALTEMRLGVRPGRLRKVESALRPHLEWADTVFVEWCSVAAALVTLVDPGSTRVVVRLHAFETFTWWPHLVDFSRVDDLVFVSDLMRGLTVDAFPRLVDGQAPRLHTIGNAMRLDRFVRPKEESARFTLALTGLAQIAKDPLWALRVLRLLREQDSRYRLLLIGDGFDPAASPAARAYGQELERGLAPLVDSGAARQLGRTDDVPRALTGAGVILSSSVRESFHLGLVEGAASGAVPVVRDWPFVAGRPHSARTLFPSDWVVSSPEEAARRILDTTADPAVWEAHRHKASSHALGSWDWPVVQDRLDGLLLGARPQD